MIHRIKTIPHLLPVSVFAVFFSLGVVSLINGAAFWLFNVLHMFAVPLSLMYYVYLDAESRETTNSELWAVSVFLLTYLLYIGDSVFAPIVASSPIPEWIRIFIFGIPLILYVIFRSGEKSDRHKHELPALSMLIAFASTYILIFHFVGVNLGFVTQAVLEEGDSLIQVLTNPPVATLALLLLIYTLSRWLVDTYIGMRYSAD